MLVWLADPAEIAGDRFGTAEMDVRAVGAARVQGFDDAGADDQHPGGKGRQVAVGLLLFHLAHADEPAGHERLVGDGLAGTGDQPREVLRRAHFQRHRRRFVEALPAGAVAEHLAAIVGDRNEGAAVAFLLQPGQIGGEFGGLSSHAVDQRLVRTSGGRFAIDLLRGAVFRHDRQELFDDLSVGAEQ